MAVHIRLSRGGSKKRPFYRIVVADQRAPRGGRFLESIGTYDPRREPESVELKTDRFEHWVGVGAQPSATVRQLIRRQKKSSKQADSAK